MRNKFGFTLVELLVVIVILGVVTGISIPLLRNVQENNRLRQYTTYADSLKHSAKLYIDSYGEDIFGRRPSGCGYVSYNDMKERGYIKDINLDDVSCNSENTFVKVVKMDNRYVFTPYLGCGKRTSDNKTDQVSIIYPQADTAYEMDTTICNNKGSSMIVSMGVAALGSVAQRQKATVVITSPTGIDSNVNISAAWSKNNNFDSVSWTKANFTIPVGQKGLINAGEMILAESQEFTTPAGDNGDYYLLVKVEQLDDLYGSHWRNTQTPNSPYVYFGAVKVDNTNPTCQLQVTASGVSFLNRNDNTEVVDYGMGTNTTPNYNKTETLSLENGNFYGYVKDSAGNQGSCSATIGGTTPSKYTKTTKSCNKTAGTASGTYYTYSMNLIAPVQFTAMDMGECHTYASMLTTMSGQCGPSNVGKISAHPSGTEVHSATGFISCRIIREECKSYPHSCTLGTCNSGGCSCSQDSYYFGTPATAQNVYPCTANTYVSCDANHVGVDYVSCTPTEFVCVNSGYTKITNGFCYKIN